jgi:hypothetical protein
MTALNELLTREQDMADDAKTVPTFRIDDGSVTHLHGTLLPSGLITVGSSLASAKASTPEQSDWAVNGAYDFAEQLRKK